MKPAIPNDWHIVTRAFVGAFPGSILAGGALRDLYLGNDPSTVKDLDIFVPSGTDEDRISELAFGLGWEWKRQVINMYNYEGCDGTVFKSIAYGSPYGPLDLNVIVMAEGYMPEARVHKFDFGICQIAFDGFQVWTTTDFQVDFADKTFTLVRAESKAQYDRSLQRWDRFGGRFPGYRLVVTEELRTDFEHPDLFPFDV